LSLESILSKPILGWKDHLVNDFEAGIFQKYPAIEAVKATLYDLGASYAAMTGSGSAVFGLFNSAIELPDSWATKGYSVWQETLR
jgi:4-diphosphocytidyl-2-C-methyl-D-erythritol kinase